MILRRDGLLTNPVLHLSGYLNSRRNTYIDLMYKVSSEDALDEWMDFISEGLHEQAKSTSNTIDSLLRYRDALRMSSDDINETRVVDMLFRNPYVTSGDLVDGLGISAPTANRILNRMTDSGVLREVTGRKRNRMYRADGISEILR